MKKKQQLIVIGAVLSLLVIGGTAYAVFFRAKLSPLALELVKKSDIVEKVSANGVVKSSDNVDLAFEVGGKVASVNVKNGDIVKAGQSLIVLDSSDLAVSARQAQVSLDLAKVQLAKLLKPADSLAMLQANDKLSKAEQSKKVAEDNLQQAYDDGYSVIANAFLDLPSVMSGLDDILLGYGLNSSQYNLDYYRDTAKQYNDSADLFRDDSYNSYQIAKAAYDQNFNDYKTLSRYSDPEQLDHLINETYDTTKLVAAAVKNAKNLIDLYDDVVKQNNLVKPAAVEVQESSHQSSLQADTTKTNSHLQALLDVKNSISSANDGIVNADSNISEQTEAIKKLNDGADSLDIQSQQLQIKQAQDNLLKIQNQISKTFLRAPFDGVISRQDASLGEIISPVSSIASIISNAKFQVETWVSEADLGKIKTGNTATVTLDAYSGDQSFSARVVNIDPAATQSNGVSAYRILLEFVDDNPLIKDGMTANIEITTSAKSDVLVIPKRDIITRGLDKFVLVSSNGTTEERQVETGIEGADGNVEITNGLAEGEMITSFGSK